MDAGALQAGVPEGVDQRTYRALLERPIIAIPIPSTTTGLNLLGRPCILCGWAIREDAGAVAKFELVSGQTDNDAVIASQTLLANTNAVAGLSPDGPYCPAGLRLKRDSGTLKGAVWVKV